MRGLPIVTVRAIGVGWAYWGMSGTVGVYWGLSMPNGNLLGNWGPKLLDAVLMLVVGLITLMRTVESYFLPAVAVGFFETGPLLGNALKSGFPGGMMLMRIYILVVANKVSFSVL